MAGAVVNSRESRSWSSGWEWKSPEAVVVGGGRGE
jgi:hypothetical protein